MSLNLCRRTLRLDLNMKAIARKATEICLSIFRFSNGNHQSSSNQETRRLQTTIDSVSWLASLIQSGCTKMCGDFKHYFLNVKRSVCSHKHMTPIMQLKIPSKMQSLLLFCIAATRQKFAYFKLIFDKEHFL